ncbi:MAG: DNA-directed DNA polymerase II small subunit [Promethearchaeota archaeon]
MENISSEEKKIILDKLVNVGINITPEMLNFILTLPNPLEEVNHFIKKTSFLPTFTNHLTDEVLMKISENEIKRALSRNIKEKNQLQIEPIEQDKKIEQGEKLKPKVLKDNNKLKKKKLEANFEISSYSEKSINSIISRSPNINENMESIIKKKNNKVRIVKATGANKSTFSFNPIAKEYDSYYEIIKDPTGKIHTSGEYEDFYNLTIDKYDQLRKLMKKRPETLSASNIANILRNSRDQFVSVIGLVNEIRETKNNNYFLIIEDSTGLINVIVKRDTENLENLITVEKTIQDQMIYIEGTYNPGEKGNRGIIFATNILKIDIPNNYSPNISPNPLSIALLSDLHIGSKEFEIKLWKKFIQFLNGKVNDNKLRNIAGKIKYIIINGDLIDGVGVYPNQKEDLIIKDIYKQYKKASELLSDIPDYIQIFYSSGNHDPVRNALPRPAVPKKYSNDLINIGVKCIGNPSLIRTHEVNTLIYHGDSILDMNLLINGLENEKPTKTMIEFLKCRHLAPVYGKRTQIAPTSQDWLVIDKIPDIFHTGHVHINGRDKYKNVTLINSGCFQAQTDFMKSFGISPTPGIVPIIELDTYKCSEIDFKHI